MYAGTRWQAKQLWYDADNCWYFQLLRDYADVIAIEVVGHDHYSDLRYHSSDNVCDLPDTETKFDFHNMFVSPGITPIDNSNPGVAYFELDENLVPGNLRLEFVNIGSTLGNKDFTYADAEWWSVDYTQDFNLPQVDPTSLATFRKYLEDPANQDYALNYLVSKLGFNPNDSTQYQ